MEGGVNRDSYVIPRISPKSRRIPAKTDECEGNPRAPTEAFVPKPK